VISNPAPVKTVNHDLPLPPKVLSAVVPGMLSSFQRAGVQAPHPITSTLSHGFSLSGNSARW